MPDITEKSAVSADKSMTITPTSANSAGIGGPAHHAHVDHKKIAELAGQARALLRHPTPPNVESVKALLTKIVRLCEKSPSINLSSPEAKKSATLLEKSATAAIASMRGTRQEDGRRRRGDSRRSLDPRLS